MRVPLLSKPLNSFINMCRQTLTIMTRVRGWRLHPFGEGTNGIYLSLGDMFRYLDNPLGNRRATLIGMWSLTYSPSYF